MLTGLRLAFRQLRRNPGFTTIAVLNLALGIGANTAMFSVINAVLLRPLPFHRPNELFAVWQEYPKRAWPEANFSLPNFIDLKRDAATFAAAGAYALSSHTLTELGAEAQRLDSIRMTAGLLPTLGIRPVPGRNFSDEEDRPEAPRVALISHRLWQRRFHSDPAIVGRTIQLNDEWPVTIVGVLPREFRLGDERPDLCLPLRLNPREVGRGQRGLTVIARLNNQLDPKQLNARLAAVAAQLREADPWANAEVELNAKPLHARFVGEARSALLTLGGAVSCVLLIACANVANLLLARLLARRPEMNIRTALGAARGQLIRQLLSESLLLSLIGGAAGFMVGILGVRMAESFLLANLPQVPEVTLDPTVLIFTFVAAVLTGLIFGIAPALSASRVNMAMAREASSASTLGVTRTHLQHALIVAEVSIAFVLLTGAGLLLRSLGNLVRFDPGFDTSNMLVAHTVLAGNRYSDNNASRMATVREVTRRLEALPGVTAVTVGSSLPLNHDMDASGAAIHGRSFAPGETPFAHIRGVRHNYFETLKVPLIDGRAFSPSDHELGSKVAIINAAMARQYWPEGDALGKQIRPDALQTEEWLTIVGVAADFKNESLNHRPRPEIYYPYAQFPTRGLSLMVRCSVPPLKLAERLRKEIWTVDGSLAITDLRTMEQTKARSFRATTFQSTLLGSFAILALLMATTGIYGVLSFTVAQRSREIGIRIALGAGRNMIHAMVVQAGMRVVLLGIVIGLLASFILTRFISGLLFQTATMDAVTLMTTSLVLGGAALAACYLPSRRAARKNPMAILGTQ
jgi:putative ABC transport system permease protein